MASTPQQITVSLTGEQAEKLQELQKITGHDTTNVIRAALQTYYEKIMADEEGKELAKINALLDVQ
ncbi:MAG: ribbon-helix-helix protein, CopG family [Sulfurovum sp.]|nr:ribbon-helix-helix protein, CopG family [Sulfurovum sp.]